MLVMGLRVFGRGKGRGNGVGKTGEMFGWTEEGFGDREGF